MINFQTKNRETSLALRGPELRGSLTESVSSSVAFAHNKRKIQGEKTDNMINMIDSLLRRNKEGDEDDVLIDDEDPAEIVTESLMDFGGKGLLNNARVDFYYNRQGHQLLKLFYVLV